MLRQSIEMEQGNDTEYIQKVKNGDTEAFSFLVGRYSGRVYSLVAGICRTREDAEEITQDTFVKAFINIGKFNYKSNFMTWLYRIAYNTAVSHLRKDKKRFISTDVKEFRAPDETNAEDDDTLSRERDLSTLEKAVGELEPQERTLLFLFYKDNMPLSAIATVMGISETNAKTRLHRIRNKTEIIYRKIEKYENEGH